MATQPLPFSGPHSGESHTATFREAKVTGEMKDLNWPFQLGIYTLGGTNFSTLMHSCTFLLFCVADTNGCDRAPMAH